MTSVTFLGRVLPERANVRIPEQKVSGSIGGSSDGTPTAFSATFQVDASVVTVRMEVQGRIDILSLRNAVEQLVRIPVDAFGYVAGRAYDVEITASVDEDGRSMVYGVGLETVLSDSWGRRPFNDLVVTQLAMQHAALRVALASLRESVRSPGETPQFCYRAVEAVRQYFRNGGSDSSAWEAMRGALRIDRDYLNLMTPDATAVRHGESILVPAARRIALMRAAWTVVDRFCMYLQGGGAGLGSDLAHLTVLDFPSGE